MNAAENAQKRKMPWHRAFQGSFLSSLFGWVVMNVLSLVLIFLREPKPFEVVSGFWFFSLFSGLFVLAVWMAFLLPIYHEVPSSSSIWRWPISTGIGLLSGYLVMGCFVYLFSPHKNIIETARFFLFNGFSIYASICGAATGLFAGLTARYFHKDSENN
jgi:hypothetical protein